MNITIIPAGAWGTAMAIHLYRLGHTVTLVPHTTEEALSLATERENKLFFPGHVLSPDMQIGMEQGPALMEAEVVILACPSKYLRALSKQIADHVNHENAWQLKGFVTLCKGLEPDTHKLPT